MTDQPELTLDEVERILGWERKLQKLDGWTTQAVYRLARALIASQTAIQRSIDYEAMNAGAYYEKYKDESPPQVFLRVALLPSGKGEGDANR